MTNIATPPTENNASVDRIFYINFTIYELKVRINQLKTKNLQDQARYLLNSYDT